MSDNKTPAGVAFKVATRETTYSGETADVQAVSLVTVAGSDDAKTATDVSSSNALPTDVTRELVATTSAQTATWTSATAQDTALTLTVAGMASALISFVNNGGSLTDGLIVFEGNDGVNWFPVNVPMDQVTYGVSADSGFSVGFLDGLSTAAAFRANTAGYTSFRLRLATVIAGTGQVAIRLFGVGTPAAQIITAKQDRQENYLVESDYSKMSAQVYGTDGTTKRAIKTDTSGQLQTKVVSENVVDTNNSSTTALTNASPTFTGTATDALAYSSIAVFINSDLDTRCKIFWSDDGSQFEDEATSGAVTDEVPTTENIGSLVVPIRARYFKVIATKSQSGTATYTRIQTILRKHDAPGTVMVTGHVRNGAEFPTNGLRPVVIGGLNQTGFVNAVRVGNDGSVPTSTSGGNVLHDANATSVPVNPTLIGGYANSTAPADVSTNGDAVRGWFLRNGAQATVITAGANLIGGDATNGLDVDVTRCAAHDVTNAGTFAVQDSEKVADNAAFTDGTTKVQPVGYVFDDVAGTALTENDIAAARINANRAQVATIEDPTTRGRGATVTASNALKVDNSGVTQPVSNAGTFVTQENGSALTALQLIDDPVKADDAGFTVATDKVMMAGAVAVAHGSNPDAADANDAVAMLTNRHRIPFVMGGHPNIVTVKHTTITTAVTDAAIITVSSGTKIVVTAFTITLDNASTVFPTVLMGFAATNTPTTTGVIAAHGGVPAGGGFSRGDGSGIIGIGADGEDLRITTTGNATGNGLQVVVTYYTIES